MNVIVSYVGTMKRDARIIWPEDWPIPRVGDAFDVSSLGLDEVSSVREVVWYPHGDIEAPDRPFVYIVVGPAR